MNILTRNWNSLCRSGTRKQNSCRNAHMHAWDLKCNCWYLKNLHIYELLLQVQRKQNTHAIDQRGLCRCSKLKRQVILAYVCTPGEKQKLPFTCFLEWIAWVDFSYSPLLQITIILSHLRAMGENGIHAWRLHFDFEGTEFYKEAGKRTSVFIRN